MRRDPHAPGRVAPPTNARVEGTSVHFSNLDEDQRLLIIYSSLPFWSFFFKRPSTDGHRWLCLTCTSSCFRELFERAHAKSTRRTAADALVGPAGQRFSAHSPRGVTILRAVPVQRSIQADNGGRLRGKVPDSWCVLLVVGACRRTFVHTLRNVRSSLCVVRRILLGSARA